MANKLYLSLILLLLGLLPYYTALGVDREVAPVEQESGDVSEPEAETAGTREGSGSEPVSANSRPIDEEPSLSTESNEPTEEPSLFDRMRWTTYYRSRGNVEEATLFDAREVVRRRGLLKSVKNSVDCKSGMELKSPIGILYEDEEYYTEPHLVESGNPGSLKPLDTSQYPGFATGLLKSRNCTAFLIGKTSALTLADCVYDSSTGRWTDDLDLWRGRNCNTYIEQMRWESVTIPYQFYQYGDSRQNWAYIKYHSSTSSENWIGLSYDSFLKEKTDVHVTLNGYPREKSSSGCPFQSPCLLLGKKGQVYCSMPSPYSFPGGPLVAAPSTPASMNLPVIGNSPRLYGIAARNVLPSLNDVTTISEEMFWLIYDLMDSFDDKPECNLHHQHDWFIINRVLKHTDAHKNETY